MEPGSAERADKRTTYRTNSTSIFSNLQPETWNLEPANLNSVTEGTNRDQPP